jgi:hypothetical protein
VGLGKDLDIRVHKMEHNAGVWRGSRYGRPHTAASRFTLFGLGITRS